MQKKIIIFSLAFSFLIHCIAIFFISLEISNNLDPVIFSWPQILSTSDLQMNTASIKLPSWEHFSYFKSLIKENSLSTIDKPMLKPAGNGVIAPQLVEAKQSLLQDKAVNFLYLWDRPIVSNTGDEQNISYKTYISRYGKVVFSFPEKLTLDSYSNISSQQYLRESAIFLKDNFFWTKLETVVR
jgi:hypothetical protein